MHRPHKAEKGLIEPFDKKQLKINTKLKEEIRVIRISSVFIALCFRQTEPLGVHTYAFGAHPLRVQFVQSVLFSVQPKRGYRNMR